MENFTEYLKIALAHAYTTLCDKSVCVNGDTISITLPLSLNSARFLVIQELLTNEGYKSVLTPLLADFDVLTARTLLASLIVLNESFIAGTPCYIFDEHETHTCRHFDGLQIYAEPLCIVCSLLHSDVLQDKSFSEFKVREFERIRLELSQLLSMTPISEQNPPSTEGDCE